MTHPYEDVYQISPDVAALALSYEAAEVITGVPAEALALTVGRYGDHLSRGDAPAPVDVGEMTISVMNTDLAPGVEPVIAGLGALAGRGERMSA